MRERVCQQPASYIAEGLQWLLNELKKKQVEILLQVGQGEQPDQAEKAEA
jgi:hypothetical protein